MKLLRNVGFGEISPSGVMVIGVILAVAGLPVVKKAVRGIAVSTVGAVMAAQDFIKNTGDNINREWQSVLDEARLQKRGDGKAVKEHLFDAGIGLAEASLAMADRAKDKISSIKENISQARDNLLEAGNDVGEATGIAADEVDTMDNTDKTDNEL